jgi:hypothetical protein
MNSIRCSGGRVGRYRIAAPKAFGVVAAAACSRILSESQRQASLRSRRHHPPLPPISDLRPLFFDLRRILLKLDAATEPD